MVTAISNLVVAHRYCAWCDDELGTRLFDARVEANQNSLKKFGRIITNDMCPRCSAAILAADRAKRKHRSVIIKPNAPRPVPHAATDPVKQTGLTGQERSLLASI